MKKEKFLWDERDADLEKVTRYNDPNCCFEVMFYRTNLLIHKKRVREIVKKLLIYAGSCMDLDPLKTELISEHHDDYELVPSLGDVALQLKLQMDDNEKEKLKEKELQAVEIVSKSYPKFIRGYRYKELLRHAIMKDCPEAQLHSLADKIDGLSESTHEVLAGNTVFLEAVINYHLRTFNNLQKNFPLIKNLFNDNFEGEFFNFPVVNIKSYFQKGRFGSKPHTKESILENKTGIPFYEVWKELTLDIFPNGMELLTHQKESHH